MNYQLFYAGFLIGKNHIFSIEIWAKSTFELIIFEAHLFHKEILTSYICV